MKNKSFARKRMMFIQKEDYNFLTYNLIILLHTLKCVSPEKKFKDFRKVAYLIEFINSGGDITKYSRDELASIYSKAQLKKQLISHLLVVLRNHNFIDVSINSVNKSFDIWLNIEEIPADFFNKKLFKKEIENINLIKKQASHLSVLTVKTLVDRLFTSNNILTWEI
ncbi:hypothetical protein [Labilibaculum euxinus]|uniref:Uncharacterized protein n=1 Tax=Labilibaculum euxinus TaxID=2686357 RepID=A0A7M4DBM5_9BACT|nr:hypothetical protein [Labilibaculum euxinus]MUP40054.1 hypothetical protein [Labilibaculum euxinus]MVB09259.1 hypothetical protein [Labilibaculum euxinus]